MRVIGSVGVVVSLRKRRQDNHGNWSVALRRLIPGDQQYAAASVSAGTQDQWSIPFEPPISMRNRTSAATVMHVVAKVGHDEVVSGHRAGREIASEF